GESKLFSWMYRIATNEAITFLNSKAKRLQITNMEVQDIAIKNLTADVYFEGDTIQLKLQQAIAKLPQKQQLVFNMKYFEALKFKDMSEILKTSEGALKASYHIAVKKIEEYLVNN
ncbi:MAG: sigma-70 family RNA polymerase sigma factor, partial [Flavobacteriales bacterium]|nr:sigma-70 family RNA polymerase sigma factor [Flavobacteriales bacterium]